MTDLFVDLEEQFSHDAKCNLNHELIGVPCTIEVVAVGSCCAVQARLCASAVWIIRLLIEVDVICPWCNKPASQCPWRVVAA
jgi:hypothetical protein